MPLGSVTNGIVHLGSLDLIWELEVEASSEGWGTENPIGMVSPIISYITVDKDVIMYFVD